jgi:Spy/CpxP family protein refolding chaperone
MKVLKTAGWIAAAILLVGAVQLANNAIARPQGGGCHGGGMFRHFERHLEGIQLDTRTREAVTRLLEESREAKQASREEMRAAHVRMRELLEADKPDLDAILAQADSLGALKTEARKAQLRTLVGIRGLLTPEQWTELKGRMESEKSHRKQPQG